MRLLAAVITGLLTGSALLADDATFKDTIQKAVAKSLPLLQKGAAGHIAQKTCFACHNQAVPILALLTAKRHGFKMGMDDLPEQMNFINEFLDRNREAYRKGKGQGGQAATAGYALWTLEMGGFKPNETTAAVAEYLLEFQKDRDHWRMTSNRPPSETSHFTTTYLAIRGLQAYGTPDQKDRISKRFGQAKSWLLKAPAKDTEDRVFRLWALKRLDADAADLDRVRDELLKTQRDDGGWGQLESTASDSYATGSALVALREAGGLSPKESSFERGIAFLLKTQLPDGSWYVHSRSKPFQAYYETGFPHGKDQFISIAASAWATTALALTQRP